MLKDSWLVQRLKKKHYSWLHLFGMSAGFSHYPFIIHLFWIKPDLGVCFVYQVVTGLSAIITHVYQMSPVKYLKKDCVLQHVCFHMHSCDHFSLMFNAAVLSSRARHI